MPRPLRFGVQRQADVPRAGPRDSFLQASASLSRSAGEAAYPQTVIWEWKRCEESAENFRSSSSSPGAVLQSFLLGAASLQHLVARRPPGTAYSRASGAAGGYRCLRRCKARARIRIRSFWISPAWPARGECAQISGASSESNKATTAKPPQQREINASFLSHGWPFRFLVNLYRCIVNIC